MNKIYIGPLWGNQNIFKRLEALAQNQKLVFYGGFDFFSDHNFSIIDNLIHFKTQFPETEFHFSRLEENFLILSNLLEEKNYLFKRWINPFSGILSVCRSYGISPLLLMRAPENFYTELHKKDLFVNHISFYQNLSATHFPRAVLTAIEESISNQSAFKHLSLYDERGETIEQIPHHDSLLNNYLDFATELLKEHERCLL